MAKAKVQTLLSLGQYAMRRYRSNLEICVDSHINTSIPYCLNQFNTYNPVITTLFRISDSGIVLQGHTKNWYNALFPSYLNLCIVDFIEECEPFNLRNTHSALVHIRGCKSCEEYVGLHDLLAEGSHGRYFILIPSNSSIELVKIGLKAPISLQRFSAVAVV